MKYDSQALRALLCAAFDDEELRMFCYDHGFREVADDFTTGQKHAARAQALIEHCDRRNCIDRLLRAVEQANPPKYAEYAERLAAETLDERLRETLRLYLAKSFKDDQYVRLDQAGETDSERNTLLRQVFVDLELKLHEGPQPLRFKERPRDLADLLVPTPEPRESGQGQVLSAMRCFLRELWPMLVMIGGPGQGKSTLGQYLAQVHRSILLDRRAEAQQAVSGVDQGTEPFQPTTTRTPFRIILKYFAQWLSDGPPADSVEAYLAGQIGKGAARAGQVSESDVQEILRARPALIIFDGLDEVTEPALRGLMLKRVEEFLDRAELLEVDLQVLATSRLTGYSGQFSPDRFLHLDLQPMRPEQVRVYGGQWSQVKVALEEERRRVLETLEECLQDEHTRLLLTTPLQVTIILLIIKDGGRPPSQREALFHNYWVTIFRREKAKTRAAIRTDEQLLFDLHAYLGYLLHRRAAAGNVRSLLPEADFKREVYRFLRKKDGLSAEATIAQRAVQMVEEARDRLVLLVELEPGYFGFELRSFQEFFAAAYLAQTAQATIQRFNRLKAIARSEHWRNVALFFAGRIVRSFGGEAANILELVCRPIDRAASDRYLRRGAWLALDIAADGALADTRDLQYSTVEYALTVLESGLTVKQREHLSTALRRLSPDDRRDILAPLLEQKIASLPVACLETALDLYGQFVGTQPVFIQGLEALLATNQPRYVQSALGLGFQRQVDTRWMGLQLGKYWSTWSEQYGTGMLWRWWHQSPHYIQAILLAWSPSEDQTHQLLNNLFTEAGRTAVSHASEMILVEKPSSLVDQIIATFQYLNILFEQLDEFWHGHSAWIENTGIIGIKFTNLYDVVDHIKRFDIQLSQLLEYPNLLPHLRIVLRLLSWLKHAPTIDQIVVFTKEVQIWATNDDLFEAILWWLRQFESIRPLLAFTLQQKLKRDQEILEHLQSYLDFQQELAINRQVRAAFETLAEKVPAAERAEYILNVRIGEKISIPELAPIASHLGITESELVRLQTASWPSVSRYSSRDIQRVFSAIERSPHQEFWDKFWFIGDKHWPRDQDLIDHGKQLLNTLINRLPQMFDYHQVITFFLKLLAVDETVLQLAPQLLEAIATLHEAKIREYAWLISRSLSDVPAKRLEKLATFTTHENTLIQRGAFTLWEVLIEAIQSAPEYGIGTEAQRRKLKSLRFDWNIGLSLAGDADGAKRKQGIALLTLSNFPAKDTTHRATLLDTMAKAQEEDELDAWARLLREIPIARQMEAGWRTILESILSQPRTYTSTILNAAMDRYAALVGEAGGELVGDEAALGLPAVAAQEN